MKLGIAWNARRVFLLNCYQGKWWQLECSSEDPTHFTRNLFLKKMLTYSPHCFLKLIFKINCLPLSMDGTKNFLGGTKDTSSRGVWGWRWGEEIKDILSRWICGTPPNPKENLEDFPSSRERSWRASSEKFWKHESSKDTFWVVLTKKLIQLQIRK